MTDNSHSNPWKFKNLAQIITFDELTLDICVGIHSFMLLLMSADSLKVLKKSIRVSNGLDPDQDRRRDDESGLEYD